MWSWRFAARPAPQSFTCIGRVTNLIQPISRPGITLGRLFTSNFLMKMIRATLSWTIATTLMLGAASPARGEDKQTLKDRLREREEFDKTVWKEEALAQEHESVFVKLWDEIRRAEGKLSVLDDLRFEKLFLGEIGEPEALGNGVSLIRFSSPGDDAVPVDRTAFGKRLSTLRRTGWHLRESEWHHSEFQSPADGMGARSMISFVLHVEHPQKQERVALRGKLALVWKTGPGSFGMPEIETITVAQCQMISRSGPLAFREILTFNPAERPRPGPQRIHPLILHDFDGDGLSEIILGGVNEVLWREGDQFVIKPFLSDWQGEIGESGVLADFTGDGIADFVAPTAKTQRPMLFEGAAGGLFSKAGRLAAEIPPLATPSVLTAGDIDGDGDLDLWLTQYRRAYNGGQMPTPYYDANDGDPSYLLINDGTGKFTDRTAGSGLDKRRFRRTYASSFVDLDGDRDLDLMVVSDFSGVDLYANDGKGNFKDVRDQWLGEWHNFGMGHVLDDFDGDGQLDFYVTGMSSTTMRRLTGMGLGRKEFAAHDAKRPVMGYGNRMYLGRSANNFVEPPASDALARTGWSWGCTSQDFDNDGDRDIYVTNGHISGNSAQDYCTKFWCHDIYTGSAHKDGVLNELLNIAQNPIWTGDVSWNGFEHNALLMNRGGLKFDNLGFPMAVGLEADCRAVVGDDLDGDGLMDLLVVEEKRLPGNRKYQVLHVLRNELKNENRWIGVRVGSAPGRSWIGAEVKLTHGDRTVLRRLVTGDSFYCQHAPLVHFGLGAGEKAAVQISVRWPDGGVVNVSPDKDNQWIEVQAISK